MFVFLPKGPDASRWACAYFFAICGLAYGSVMARIPAIKAAVGLDEAQLGTALLCLGLGGLTAFPLTGWVQSRIGSRIVQIVGGVALLLAFPLIGLPEHFSTLCMVFYVMGLSSGAAEVAMGTQAVLVERALQKSRMSSLHAMYSLGGLLGSGGGSLMVHMPPFTHFCIVAGLMLCILPFAASRLMDDKPEPSKAKEPFRWPPLIVFLLGLLALFSYSTEGTVGDWGALFLNTVKGASEQTAALAYAAFSCTMLIGRLAGDRLRGEFGDYKLMSTMSVIATCGMLVNLLSPWPWLCMAGYAMMGIGLSVVVPIVFSAVGKMPGVSPSAGVTVVSTLGYGGLLMAPPLIGFLAHAVGLYQALFVVVGLCLGLVAGSRLLKKR